MSKSSQSNNMLAVEVWKHATRLDEPQTAAQLARALDFWGYGPIGFVKQHFPSSISKPSSQTIHNPNAYRTPIAAQYVIFSCADGQRYLVSHAVARMCDSLSEILDDLDLVGGLMTEDISPRAADNNNNNSNADEGSSSMTVDEALAECALLEVAVPSSSLEAVLVYLAAAIERGSTSVIPYPLTGLASNLENLVQPWEMQFLDFYTPALPLTASSPQLPAAPDNGNRFFPPTPSIPSKIEPVVCPPLISALRAADYLGINSLRDLTCASLATKLLNNRDEAKLSAMLGLQTLPSEAELEDVYARFPFLAPSRYGRGNSGAPAASSGGNKSVGNHHAPNAP